MTYLKAKESNTSKGSGQVCPANPIAVQGFSKAIETIATYSPNILDCFASFAQDGQLSKMSQGYSQLTLDGSFEQYSGSFPKSGMMSSGKLYHVPHLEELIAEKDCGCLLPTPVKSDSTVAACITENMQFKQTSNGTVRKITKSGKDGSIGLTRTLKLLPTPKYSDRYTAGVKTVKPNQTKHLSTKLNDFNPKPGLLNPEFVERMMGFPLGWTDLELQDCEQPELLTLDRLDEFLPTALDDEDISCRRKRLAALGNAIVPQVAAVILKLLEEILKQQQEQAAIAKQYSPLNELDTSSVGDKIIDKLFPKKSGQTTRRRFLNYGNTERESAELKVSANADNHIDVAQAKLEKLEAIINRQLKGEVGFYQLGKALFTIKSAELYKKAGYTNFRDYCRARFDLGKTTVYQLINAAKVKDNVFEIVEEYKIELNEANCRELSKIKDVEIQREVLAEVAKKQDITARSIAAAVKVIELKRLNEKETALTVPPRNTIIRVTSRHDPESPSFKGYWGVVIDTGEFSCDVRVLGAKLTNVHPQHLLKCPALNDREVSDTLKLLDRLDAIANHPDIDLTVKTLLNQIATNSYPELTKWQKIYLKATEQVIFDSSAILSL